MINITSKDFNMDMDKYIKNRREREDESQNKMKDKITDITNDMREWKIFTMFKKRDKRYIDDYEEDDDDEDYTEEEVALEAIDEVEDELEREREGILKRFFKKLRFKKRKEENYDDVSDEYDNYEKEDNDMDLDDVKEVIKITHKWLERLPQEEIERFKRSEDFQKYKEILQRLEMIK